MIIFKNEMMIAYVNNMFHLPAGQSVQTELPELLLYLPVEHMVHVADPAALNVPALHSVHDEAPAPLYVPAAQVLHVNDEVTIVDEPPPDAL